ncbi:hypothetical protein EMIT0P228_210072 [Pseudomonas brassicacearum]
MAGYSSIIFCAECSNDNDFQMIIIIICSGLSTVHFVLCLKDCLTSPLLQLSAPNVLLLFGLPNTAFDQFFYPCAEVLWRRGR